MYAYFKKNIADRAVSIGTLTVETFSSFISGKFLDAILLGLLFGYVYYKTGSLKLTMLMHFTNNTLAIVLSNIDSLKDIESFYEVMTPWVYALVCVLNIAIVAGAIWYFSRIEEQRPEGSCDILDESAR